MYYSRNGIIGQGEGKGSEEPIPMSPIYLVGKGHAVCGVNLTVGSAKR